MPPETALAGGELVHRKLVADPKHPARVEAAVGDQLQLRVTSKRPATLELVGLGPTEDVDPAAPALFDVLLDRKGTFRIRALETGKVVGRIRGQPSSSDGVSSRSSSVPFLTIRTGSGTPIRSGPMRRWSAETSVTG